MTICIATQEYGPVAGGIASFYGHLVPMLAAKGHSVIVLTIDAENGQAADLIEKNGNICVVHLRKSFQQLYDRFVKRMPEGNLGGALFMALGTAMKNWLSANGDGYGIDVVEAVDYGGIGLFLTGKDLPPVVVCGHGANFQIIGYDYFEPDQNIRILTWLEKMALEQADAIITHSHQNRLELENTVKKEVLFSRAPWNFPLIGSPMVADPGIDILVIGRMQTCKGVKVVADALVEARKNGWPIQLTWVGDDTHSAPYGYTWSKYLKKHYAAIWQTGFRWVPARSRPALTEMIRSAKMVLVPSTWEAFSYASLEAVAENKPILISSGAGAAYLFSQKVNAMVFKAGDPGALLKGMKELLSEEGLREALPRAALQAVREKLDPASAVDERIAAYCHAIEKRKKRIIIETDIHELLGQFNYFKSPFSYYVKKYFMKGVSRFIR